MAVKNPPVSQTNAIFDTLPGLAGAPISVDTANRMIASYLNSIHYKENTNAIRSWTFNADTLRRFLNSDSGRQIVRLKLMLAHTMKYIEDGHEGQPLPVDSHELTLVIIGVDAHGKYRRNEQNNAYDHCAPCPSDCVNGDFIALQY